MGHFSGSTVIVTGGGTGIGRAVAERFAAEGAGVMVMGRRIEKLEEAVQAISMRGGEALAFAGDVSEPFAVDAAVAAALDRFGRIDVVVNNAAVADPSPFLEVRDEDWERVVATNLRGPFLVSQRAARVMARGGGGSIIHISSIAALGADGPYASYAATKSGLIGLTKTMAVELAPYGIRVNVLCPGLVRTEMFDESVGDPAVLERLLTRLDRAPLQRLMQPDEIAAACVFLASNEASAITGAQLTIDAGLTANLYVFETLPTEVTK